MANNLANINTVGYHADYGTINSKAVNKLGMQTRITPKTGQVYTDQNTGPIEYTGRDLDLAIDGKGFFAVQAKSGKEGLTRAGNFDITAQGLLITQKGELVLGAEGVINIPEGARVTIDQKGAILAKLKGDSEVNVAEIGRLKLVNPDLNQISKGDDGLFYPKGPANIQASQDVRLIPESLEGSNVDAVKALVEMVDMSRQFDFQTKLMKSVDENANKANSLLDIR